MTPIEAIVARDAPEGEPIFNEIEARCVLKRLANAGYVVMPKEPTDEMLQAGSTLGIAILNGLIALGVKHGAQPGSALDIAYRAMAAKSEQTQS